MIRTNDTEPTGPPSPTRRSLVAVTMLTTLFMLTALAVITAGCAAAPSDPGGHPVGSDSSAGNRDQAVRFAECMRGHDVGDFPDPDPSGELTVDAVANASGVDTSSATFTQAMTACRDLQPPGFTGHRRSAQQQAAALVFAQCIRDNGVKDFPDPDPDGPLVDTNRIPSAEGKGGMSALDAAMKRCNAADAGVTGGQ